VLLVRVPPAFGKTAEEAIDVIHVELLDLPAAPARLQRLGAKLDRCCPEPETETSE
jgi:hypothetical protein